MMTGATKPCGCGRRMFADSRMCATCYAARPAPPRRPCASCGGPPIKRKICERCRSAARRKEAQASGKEPVCPAHIAYEPAHPGPLVPPEQLADALARLRWRYPSARDAADSRRAELRQADRQGERR